MLKLYKCPRCGERTFEKLKTHGYCLECNFNSIEGFSWGDKEGRIAKELYNTPADIEQNPSSKADEALNFEDQDDPPEAA